jgi:hypothetical protein
MLSLYYANGTNVEKDIKKIADQDCFYAQYRMAECYKNRIGVEKRYYEGN